METADARFCARCSTFPLPIACKPRCVRCGLQKNLVAARPIEHTLGWVSCHTRMFHVLVHLGALGWAQKAFAADDPALAVVWSSLGSGVCAATGSASPNTCTCIGKTRDDRGGKCDPLDLFRGQQWCYVDPSCPDSIAVGDGTSFFSFCPPASNPGAVARFQPAHVACRPITTLEECQARCTSKELAHALPSIIA